MFRLSHYLQKQSKIVPNRFEVFHNLFLILGGVFICKMNNSDEYIRPLGQTEKFLYDIQKEGVALISYAVHLKTAKKLTYDDLHQCLIQLVR